MMTTATEHLLQLIAIPSVSTMSNRPVVDYASHVLSPADWTMKEIVYLDPAGVEKVNLIAVPPGQDPGASTVDLAFVCHTDTVPFSSAWSRALQPFIEKGSLFGCGACDVKGSLACLLEAACSAKGRYIDGLRIILTADEEIGCLGARHLSAKNILRLRRLVIAEPTSLQVARAGKGYCLAEVIVHGREAHSAHPEQGASAIYAASRLICGIEEFAKELAVQTHPLFTPACTTLNTGTIQGGSAKNIVPGECRFLLEWRPIPGQAPSHVLDAVRALAAKLSRDDDRLSFTVHPVREQQGFATSPDADLVRALEAATGRAATSIPFGSEASILAPLAQETVVFGPGDMHSAHSDRECVPVAELIEAVAVLKGLMSSA